MYLRLLACPLLSVMLAACAETPSPVATETPAPAPLPVQPAAAAAGPATDAHDDSDHQAELAATRWEPVAPITVTPAGGGLVVGGSVQFRLLVPDAAVGTTIEATIAGPHGPVRGNLTVTGPGWRRVLLPLRAMRPAAETGDVGTGLRLRVLGQVPAGVTFAIGDPRVVTSATGPSLEDDDLIAQIDWQRPELAAAGRLLASGDRRGALHGLADLIRQRAQKRRPAVSSGEGSASQAERILAGKITSIGIPHDFPEGKIAWLANPTLGTKQASSEWTWSLNRHQSWLTVAEAWQTTHDPRFATGWVRLMRSWVEQVPMPAVPDERAGSGWRDIEAGLRVSTTWFPGFYAVLDSSAVTDDDILVFVKSAWDHASHLAGAPYEPTNHFVLGMTGLYTVGSEFPEFRSAQAWRAHAGRNIDRLLAHGLLPEGAWYELAPGYGSWVCNTLIGMLTTAEACGQTAELGPHLAADLQRMAEWGVHLATPERAAPMLNDGNALPLSPASMAPLAKRFPHSALLRWAAAPLGSDVPAPAWTSEALPDSGYTILRTGWGARDSYVLLDVGPLGGWHGHQDALNLVAYFHGRYFLFDNGGHKYDASIWRAWGPTTAAHNTVLVDGLGQIRTWNGGDAGDGDAKDAIGRNPASVPAPRFATSAAADYAAGWYRSGYGREIPQRGAASNLDRPLPAAHQREVLFLKPGLHRDVLTVVLDTLTPADAAAHTYDLRWHLKTTHWKVDTAHKVTWTTDAGQPNLAVLSLSGAEDFHADSGVTKPEILGWWFPNQNDDPVPALTLRQQATAAGPVRLLTVLIPFTTNPATHPVLGVEPVGDHAWTVRLRDQAPLTIHLAPTGSSVGFSVDGVAQPQP
jgi:Heparinase II/III N-terminus/Heparinase II/III-like protein